MKQNYRVNKMKREEAKRKKKEEKRLKHLNRHDEKSPSNDAPSSETNEGSSSQQQ